MNIEELKKVMDSAATALAAKPEDEALKAAHQDAKAAHDAELATNPNPGDEGDEPESSLDENGLDEKTKAHIAKLRRENAKHRSRAKTLDDRLSKLEKGLKAAFGEDETSDPAAQAEALKAQNEGYAFKTAVLEAALEHGVGKSDREYFEFLVSKKLSVLQEGEELNDEELEEIAKSAKRASLTSKANSRTSVDDDNAPNPKGADSVTVDQFVAMNVTQKSELYTKNRALYDQLFIEAKNKRRI